MKVVLVITDSKGKNLVFSTDTLKAYSLDEAIKIAAQEKLESVHAVKTGQGSYLRTNPNAVEDDNLDSLSISANHLYFPLDDFTCLLSPKKFKACAHHLEVHFSMIEGRGEHVLYIEKHPLITREQIITKLKPQKRLILAAGKEFFVDPYVLGAIIIDEIARANPWESILDKLVFMGRNTSAGIAQVKIETARGLIRDGYYNPNPSDKKLAKENVMKTSKTYLYAYVEQPRHNIFFSAARIRAIIDQWLPVIDLSNRPEIIGTLYNQPPRTPNKNPEPSDRGVQIHKEFYPLTRSILE